MFLQQYISSFCISFLGKKSIFTTYYHLKSLSLMRPEAEIRKMHSFRGATLGFLTVFLGLNKCNDVTMDPVFHKITHIYYATFFYFGNWIRCYFLLDFLTVFCGIKKKCNAGHVPMGPKFVLKISHISRCCHSSSSSSLSCT